MWFDSYLTIDSSVVGLPDTYTLQALQRELPLRFSSSLWVWDWIKITIDLLFFSKPGVSYKVFLISQNGAYSYISYLVFTTFNISAHCCLSNIFCCMIIQPKFILLFYLLFCACSHFPSDRSPAPKRAYFFHNAYTDVNFRYFELKTLTKILWVLLGGTLTINFLIMIGITFCSTTNYIPFNVPLNLLKKKRQKSSKLILDSLLILITFLLVTIYVKLKLS